MSRALGCQSVIRAILFRHGVGAALVTGSGIPSQGAPSHLVMDVRFRRVRLRIFRVRLGVMGVGWRVPQLSHRVCVAKAHAGGGASCVWRASSRMTWRAWSGCSTWSACLLWFPWPCSFHTRVRDSGSGCVEGVGTARPRQEALGKVWTATCSVHSRWASYHPGHAMKALVASLKMSVCVYLCLATLS